MFYRTRQSKRMKSVLDAWGLADQPCTHHAMRENVVYRVGEPATHALRAHRLGLRTPAQIKAELDWMATLAAEKLPVPEPVATTNGNWTYTNAEGQIFSLVTWLPGVQLGHKQDPLALPNPTQTFESLGALLAKLHKLESPQGADRPLWDAPGLLGPDPLWGRFWEHPDLREEERQEVLEFRDAALLDLAAWDLPTRLIHADALQENVLVSGPNVALIDFDDCAYGYPAFDLVTPLVQRLPNANFAYLRDALLDGYGPIDRDVLALMLPIRCLTYMGWIQDKMDTAEGKAMSGRIVRRAVAQVRAYRNGRSPVLT